MLVKKMLESSRAGTENSKMHRTEDYINIALERTSENPLPKNEQKGKQWNNHIRTANKYLSHRDAF